MHHDASIRMARGTLAAIVLTAAGASAAPACADALDLLQAQNSKPAEAPPTAATAPAPGPTTAAITATPSPTAAKFGAENSLRFNIEGAWMTNFDQANMVQGRLGVAWFFAENVELGLYANLDYVNQPGPDAFGGGADLQLRWHLLAYESWSVFVEVGGGVMGTSHQVPTDGSSFNFTPNAGLGLTYALTETTRLYLGAGWYHMSNAGLYADNPGRDNFTLWLGLSFSM